VSVHAASLVSSHIAWDAGAALVARALSRILGAPLFEGTISRLLVDLNRSAGHPGLFPRRVGDRQIPGNAHLTSAERRLRVESYYRPYRDSVVRAVGRIVGRGQCCLHLSVHSFVPVLGGVQRRADVGVLYDPGRERAFAARLVGELRARGLAVRRNFPYRGTSDGFTSFLRRELAPDRYMGVEIEVNQTRLRTPSEAKGMGRTIASAVGRALSGRGRASAV